MTASGGPGLALPALHCSLMSSGSSVCRGRVVDGDCYSNRGLFRRRSGGRVWCASVVFVVTFLSLSVLAHSQDEFSLNRTALNTEIYFAAFRSLNNISRIRTGTIYNASLPRNLTDQSVELVQMVRLRSGSLRRYGVQMNEITLPPRGVRVMQTIPTSVILVYRRFSRYPYYNATPGDVFVAPVVGILVYNAADISNYTDYIRPELQVVSTGLPIQVQFQSPRNGTLDNVTCVMYDNTVNGSALGAVQNLSSPSSCAWGTLGDYSLVGPFQPNTISASKKSSSRTWKIVVGSVAGGIVLLALLALLGFLGVRYRERAKFANMEHKSEQGETLHHTLIGGSRALAAPSTRTKPILETDHAS